MKDSKMTGYLLSPFTWHNLNSVVLTFKIEKLNTSVFNFLFLKINTILIVNSFNLKKIV